MRLVGILLSLLLCLGVARPACAMPMATGSPHAMATAGHVGTPTPHRYHGHAAMADCVGCAIGRIDAAAPVNAPLSLTRLAYRATPATTLIGRVPSMRAPPPRLAV